MSATSDVGTVNPSGAPVIPVVQSLTFCVVICKLLSFSVWPLSFLKFPASDYPFGIFILHNLHVYMPMIFSRTFFVGDNTIWLNNEDSDK